MMTVDQLFAKLCSKEFQDVQNGDLFYNFFVFPYPANEEYAMRAQIDDFKKKLIRPTNYVDVLVLNLFDEFCTFLDKQSFGKKHPSYLNYLLEKDKTDTAAAMRALTLKANSEQFYRYIHDRIITHVMIDDDKVRPYVFLHGIGLMYPLLRTSVFLTNYEKYNKTSRYKVIVFYPGTVQGTDYELFGLINDHHTYRAIVLND